MMAVDVWKFFLVAFAVFRVARMIGKEDGPFDIFKRFRCEDLQEWEKSWIHKGLACPMCISFWLGFASAWVLTTDPITYVVVSLALSSITVIVYRLIG